MTDAPKKKGGLKLGAKVWVRDVDLHNPDVFVLGTLKGLNGKLAKVLTDKNELIDTDLFYPANPPDQDHNDHTGLLYLSDAALLSNTRIRYNKDEIYTFVGPILISVNPFKYIDHLYSPDLMSECRKYAPGHPDRPAHTFSMTEAAYKQMIKQKASQSIVVSGESGSGKTEVNKQCMNYLVWRACDASSDLATRILESNPVLEGFGNAKTVRNNNSSRFGKFVTMKFDEKHQLLGAEIQTFLLEKSRVVATTAAGERNYHVFYQVLLGSGLLPGMEPSSMRLLSRTGCTQIPRVDDVVEYHAMMSAYDAIGVSETHIMQVQQAIAGILCLGNLEFGDDEADSQAFLSDPSLAARAAELLGSTPAKMEDALLKATLKVSRTESYTIELDPVKAAAGRDAFAKAIYQRIFHFLVGAVNVSLATGGVHAMPSPEEEEQSETAEPSQLFIGLLDVFGFEIFEVNSFEQLCINFANEKLQNFFLRSVFKAEELAYKNDGIRWEPITYSDNSAIIEIIEGKDKGIYPALDSVCKAPKATDETLVLQLHENHGKSKILCRPKKAAGKGARQYTENEAFVLKHFAGDVMYLTHGWLEKNNDKLSDDYEKHLAESTSDLLANHLAKREEVEAMAQGAKPKAGKGSQTVGRSFLASLKKLMEALESTDTHFIRCIKPNNELKPNLLYGAFVLTQLKCSGTLEAVELMQKGYPSRIPYASIHERYKSYMPDFVQALAPAEFVEAIALAYGVQQEDYQLGLHKIFMRAGKAAFLEELKEANIDEMVPIIVEKIKHFEAKKHAKKVIERCLIAWIWRRRIRKLREFKRKTKKGFGKGNKGRELATHEITEILADMSSVKSKSAKKKRRQLTRGSEARASQHLGGHGGMVGGDVGPPQKASLGYGARVVSRRAPMDPNDKSAFTIHIPQGAKTIIKQAIEEYKQANQVGSAEIALIDRFLQNLATAKPPENVFGASPFKGDAKNEGATEAAAPTDLVDELTDAPQMFEYDDIAHSGHLLMKVVDLVAQAKKKKNRKGNEWQMEYFILLHTKHIVHFQPNTGFVDPFKKTISGKSIDLMSAQVRMPDEGTRIEPIPASLAEGVDASDINIFEIRTARHRYLLCPKESTAEAWVEKITEVMLEQEGEDEAQTRDYDDFLTGYNDVKPNDQSAAAGPLDAVSA